MCSIAMMLPQYQYQYQYRSDINIAVWWSYDVAHFLAPELVRKRPFPTATHFHTNSIHCPKSTISHWNCHTFIKPIRKNNIPMPVEVSIARRLLQNMEATAVPKFTSLATVVHFRWLSLKPTNLIIEGGLRANPKLCSISYCIRCQMH